MKQQIVKLGKVAITVDKNYWSITKDYDRLVMVKRQSTGVVYISRKPVPAGIEITNRDYWLSFNIGGADSTTVVNLVQEFGGDPEVAISQKVITEKIEEIEAAIASIGSTSGGHNILPFDGFDSYPVFEDAVSEQPYFLDISSSLQPVQYDIVAILSLTGNERFCLKVGDDYFTTWTIYTEVSSDSEIPEFRAINKSEWYNESRENKLFYNRSNKAIYAYDYITMGLIPVTNIQVVEENAPEAESTSNQDNATKGSIIVDLEHDKLLTWDGNKWKALSGGGSTPVDVPNSIAIRNRILYLEKVSTGSEPVVFASVELPAGGGQTVVVQSNDDSPSIVRLDTDITKLGKKVIPLGTSAANLFKNGIRENDSDVYNSTTYSTDDGTYTVYHIKYEFDLNNGSVTVPERSILKFEGGCLKNGTLVGNNTKVEVDGTYTIFDNMSFSGTFRDSSLYATNFGAIGNMVSVPKTLTYKNLVDEPINERTRLVNGVEELNLNAGSGGLESHDYKAFTSFKQFVYGSDNIKLTLNGDFYVAKVRSDLLGYSTELYIERANNLTIEGGTTTVGWKFHNCNNVTLSNTKYVGYHEVHKFPYITGTPTGTQRVNNVDIAYDFSEQTVKYIDGTADSIFGVADGIYFNTSRSITQDNKDSYVAAKGFYVNNCLVEMRGAGIYLGGATKNNNNIVTGLRLADNCVIENCELRYIKTQAFSLHGARGAKIRNCTIDYCNCPIDWSTGSVDCVIENIIATHCGMGYKHESDSYATNIYYCGNNIGRNIKITIDDSFPYVRGTEETFALKVQQASAGDVFKLYDCQFNVFDRNEPTLTNNTITKGITRISKMFLLLGNTEFNNCIFNLDRTETAFGDYSANVGGATANIDFNDCSITFKEGLYGGIFRGINKLRVKSSKITLAQHSNAVSAFYFSNNINSSTIESSLIDIEETSTSALEISDNTILKNNRVLFNAYSDVYGHGIRLAANCTIENNTINFTSTKAKGLFVINSASLSNVRINNNVITTNAGVVYRANYSISDSEIKNNIIDYTNNESAPTTSIIALGSSATNITIDGNVFKGSDGRSISNLPTYNTRIIGNLIDTSSKNTYANIPDAALVGLGFPFYDTTNNRLLMSDGIQWTPVGGSSPEDTPVTPVEPDEPTVPVYGSEEDIPETAQLGTTYFDTDNNVMKVYNGSTWVSSIQQVIPDSAGTSYNIDVPDAGVGYLFRVTSANNEIRMKLRPTGLWIALPLTNDCIVVSGSGAKGDFDTTDYTQATQIYYATDKGEYYLWYPGVEENRGNAGLYRIPTNHIALSRGTFNNAPDINEVVLGYRYYDTVRQKILTATSEGWTDNEGNVITIATKGDNQHRPAVTDITEGFKYYNTESHKEQIYNGTTWIDIEDAASAGTRVDSLVPDIVVGTISALNTTLAAAINKYYRYDTAVDTLTVTLPELVSSSKVQNVVVYLTAGSNADSTTITFAAATPTEGVAAPVYYQKSYDIEAGKTYEINALYNGAAWIIAAVEIITAVAQSSNSNNNSLLMGGFTPADTSLGDTASTDVQPENTEDI